MSASRLLCLSAALAAAVPAAARPAFPLQPLGLPFAPESPQPLAPDHPLYHRVAIDPIGSMPNKVGGMLTPITNAGEMNEALRATLEQANMLAPAGTPPRMKLTVRWIGLDAPHKISFSSEATASLGYSLVRLDSGQEIFRREISTYAKSSGGDAAERLKGNARLAIVTNLASAVLCLDKAAYGGAPADCALTPAVKFEAPRPPMIMWVPR